MQSISPSASKPPKRKRQKPVQSEESFTKQILQLAKIRGWRSLHIRPARTDKGWRTPVAGDGAGFFDLLLVRRGVIIFAELKIKGGRLSPDQWKWFYALDQVGTKTENVKVFIWSPRDWDSIERILA
jgi:hypothetical protein